MLRSRQYLGAGSPPIPGFTEAQIDQILWGELPADPEFFSALLRVLCGKPGHGRAAEEDIAVSALDDAAESFRNLLNVMRDEGTRYSQSGGTLSLKAMQYAGDSGSLYRVPPERGFTPPNPETFANITDFVKGMDDLRAWAKASLRDLETRSRERAEQGAEEIWLSRSTISDALRRTDRLPRREVAQSYVAACGLPVPAQARWLIVYDTLNVPARTRRLQAAA